MSLEMIPLTERDAHLYWRLGRTVASRLNVMVETIEEAVTELTDPQVEAFFLVEGGQIVGIFAIRHESERHVHIAQVATLPGFERRTISLRALVTTLHRFRSIPYVDLLVHPENDKAIALYTKVGFIPCDRPEIENYCGTGERRMYMYWAYREAINAYA